MKAELPNRIYSGKWGKCHCQGAAIDTKSGHVYFSFTTKLVKTDLKGNVIGTVDNIKGHLGCISFNPDDGRIYASLEYKNDSIGRGILKSIGQSDKTPKDAFYIAVFDGDKIDKPCMDAEKGGVMRTCFMHKVTRDYLGKSKYSGREYPHAHGCSGIDGLAIGPDFGSEDKKKFIFLCYGIYGDIEREDNDYQVIHKFDPEVVYAYSKEQQGPDMHTSGPESPLDEYFVYTGNTEWGIQNLEYDPYTGLYFAFVYKGKKPRFSNNSLYCIDGAVKPVYTELCGKDMKGKTLTLKHIGSDGNAGIDHPGQMGAISLGGGEFYIAYPDHKDINDLAVTLVKERFINTEYPNKFKTLGEEDVQ